MSLEKSKAILVREANRGVAKNLNCPLQSFINAREERASSISPSGSISQLDKQPMILRL